MVTEYLGKIFTPDVIFLLSLLSVFIEWVPIKINPWSWLLSKIGERLNANISKDLESVKQQLKEQETQINTNEKDRIRYEILSFASECRNHQQHTKEEFDHIFEQYDKYEVIMSKLEQPNGRVTHAMDYITELYHDRHCHNDFLV